jgi:hypothetical protein
MKRFTIAALAAWLAMGARPLAAQPQCRQDPAAAPAVQHLRQLLATARFVAYQPTSLRVIDGRPMPRACALTSPCCARALMRS